MVDDQCDTYTVDILRQMKANHEKWASLRLSDKTEAKPVTVKRIKQNIPKCFLQIGIPHFCKINSPAPVGKIRLT
jgi:hypothetical protein